MKIEIEDKAILNLLNDKHNYSLNNVELIEKMEELEKSYQTNIQKMQRLDEKAKPKILKFVKSIKLGEFDELSRVHKDEKTGKWNMEIVDRLEEFKTAFKKTRNA